MPKRARQVTVPSHCHWCGERMDQMACCIDWHAVYVTLLFKKFMIEIGRLPSEKELEEMDKMLLARSAATGDAQLKKMVAEA